MDKRTPEQREQDRERWARVHVEADRRKPFGWYERRKARSQGEGTRRERGGWKGGPE